MERREETAVGPVASADPLCLTCPRSRPGPREVLACALGLALITLVMCGVHVGRGGFYYDDWAVVALGRFPPPEGLLHGLWLDYAQRPGQVLYYAALDEAFGAQAPLRLGLAAGMVLLQATCLYALLRNLRIARRHAVAIAALSLTFPFSDSVWLWGILSLTSLAIAACLLGLTLALRALQSSGARARLLHAGSLLLYAVSISSYEVFAVAGVLAGLLYTRAVGFRAARARWAADVIVIAATLVVARALLPIDVATPSRTLSPAGMVSHVALIARQGLRLVGAAALPLDGVSPWFGVAVIAAALVFSTLLLRRLPRGSGERAELSGWLAVAGAGVLVAVSAWAVYVPAPNHYSPTAAGTVNRVNAAAAIGIAVLVYSSIVLLARLLVRLGRLPRTAGGVIAAAAACALGAGYLGRTAADVSTWDRAAADQRRLVGDLRIALPHMPPEALLYAFDAPRQVGAGVPVLNTMLDLTSALRIAYASPTVVGVPLAGAASLQCSSGGPRAGGVLGAYGRAFLIDVGGRRAVRLTGPEQCASEGGSA